MAADWAFDAAAARAPKRALWLLLVVVYINIAGFSLILPLLPFYGEVFGASPMQIAMLFAAFSLGNFFGEPYWGRLSDRIGRRRVLIVSLACAALAYFAFAFASGLWSAIALRMLGGFFSGNLSVVQGFIADVTPPERRAEKIGWFGAAFNLGFVTGPAIGGLLAEPSLGAAGFRLPIFAAAILAGSAAMWALAFLQNPPRTASKQSAPGRTSRRDAFTFAARHPIIRRLLPVSFIAVACFASMESTFGLWTQKHFGWGPRDVGFAFIGIGLAGAATQGFLIGPLSRRIGEARMMLAGLGILIVSTLLLPLARQPGMTIALMSLLMVGHSFAFPNIAALISHATPLEAQGGVLGLNLAAAAGGRIIGPPIMGFLYSAIGPDAPFYTAAALIAAASVLAWQITPLQPRPPRAQADSLT